MKQKKLLVTIIAIIAISCNNKKQINAQIGEEKQVFFTLSIPKLLENKKDIPISAISDSMDYVVLETSSKSLIGRIYNVYFTKDYILINHSGCPLLSQFDRKGKYLKLSIGSTDRIRSAFPFGIKSDAMGLLDIRKCDCTSPPRWLIP